MTSNFNAQELDKINEDAQAFETAAEIAQDEQEQPSVNSEAQTSATIQTPTLANSGSSVMTIDQSIYATVEPGTAPLLRSSTTTDNAKLFNALNGNAEPVKDWLGEDFDVADIVITSADVPTVMGDENSERVCKPCVHFYGLDGTHISSISNGIIRATKMLLACGLTPTPEVPITIRFKEIETKNGRAHTFDMV